MKKRIAVFTTGWGAEILGQFLDGMTGELKSDNADIFLFLCYAAYADTPAKRQGEMNIFNLPDLHDFDGAVIFGSGLDYQDRIDNIIARSNEAGIPVILQGSKREGVSYVGSDNYQAGKNLCAHVIEEHGVKEISFFAGTKNSLDSELRLKAVCDYLKEIGHEDYLKEVFYTNWENAVVSRHISEICENGGKLPDIFICANDGLAMEACVTLNSRGFEVPGDVAVLGIGNDPFLCANGSITISSVDQDLGRAACEACALLDRLMSSPERARASGAKTVLIPPAGVIPRASTETLAHPDPTIRAALVFIHRHLDKAFGAAEIAEAIGMPRSTLDHLFTEKIGHSIGREILNQRLLRIKRLLKDESIALNAISKACGFCNASYFINVFRRETGMTPKAWRARHRRLTMIYQ